MASRRPLGRTTALLALTVAALVLLPAAAAAGKATFALKPAAPTETGYFVFNGKPGQTLRGAVRVLNVGDVAGQTSLYAVDATTGQTSGAVYRSRQDRKRDVGAWIKLGKTSVTLAPGQSQVVSFSVRVPAGTAAGEHLGGIVAQRARRTSKPGAATGEGGEGFQVRVQELSVLAVQVNVPGPQREQMNLTGIEAGSQPGHQSVLLGIGNTGDVLVKGDGTLKIVTKGGKVVQRRSFALDTFVPGTHIDYPVYIEGKALRPGRYRGTVSISYGGRTLTRTFPFTVTKAQTTQVFGTQAAQQTPLEDSSDDKTLIYVLIGVSALSAGAAFYFWRQRRTT
jgi:hypothetical protein